jgi:hypothetical protein
MVRGVLFGGLLLASAPATASAERAAVRVALRVEPSCAAVLSPASAKPQAPTIVCADVSMKRSIGPGTPAPYTLNTYRSGDRTVISIDF